MEHETAPIKPIAYTYGLYSALISIVVLIIMYVANLDKSWILSIASFVLGVLVFVYGIKAYKLSNSNMLSIGQAVKVGLAIAVVGGLISAIYSYVHYEFIYPEFIDMQMDTAREQMLERNPNMTQEQIDQAMSMSSMFMTSTFFSLMSVIGSLIFGLIVSLIAGLIMRSDQ
ncbi:DUF4199 domain-containing protein [Ichthyenterobacterium sp. W332]|uniref:DUF4199 domain-containing protein n=1 Tax=Microcosmobacter mediterraneus TaxID=3075607 RepID=A0ABU2YGL3_9FLAO|nr:DUF4199 domain-containing protein [Ichthyenterobacterium sp. W332]MDT0557315.1 DUF4199 domain-containing protein [Ichthyenterobacterium sp. W332]